MPGECSYCMGLMIKNLTIDRHYVAFIRKTLESVDAPSWVLFNDEKVVEAYDVEEMRKFAYVYFFKRA